MTPGHPLTQGQTPMDRAALAEVQEQRVELAKARVDAAAIFACTSEHEPDLAGAWIDRLCHVFIIKCVPVVINVTKLVI